jgi:hypothetical protein
MNNAMRCKRAPLSSSYRILLADSQELFSKYLQSFTLSGLEKNIQILYIQRMRKVVIAVAFLVLVLMSAYLFKGSDPEAPPVELPSSVQKGPHAQNVQGEKGVKTQDLRTKAPSSNPDSNPNDEATASQAKIAKAIPKECQVLWDDLRTRDFTDLQNTSEDLEFKKGEGCPVPQVLGLAHEAYLEMCGLAPIKMPPLAKGQKPPPKPTRDECLAAAIHYKVNINDFLTRNIPLDQIKDLTILVDKMNAEFERDPIAAGPIAEELLRRNPKEPVAEPAARAALISKFLDAQADESGAKWQKAEIALEVLKRMPNTINPDVAEMELGIIAFKSTDNNLLAQTAQGYSDKFPNSGVGPYHQALASYYDGDMTKARAFLTEAVRREPNNPRFRDTLGRVDWLSQPGNENKEGAVDPVFSNESRYSVSTNYEDSKR